MKKIGRPKGSKNKPKEETILNPTEILARLIRMAKENEAKLQQIKSIVRDL